MLVARPQFQDCQLLGDLRQEGSLGFERIVDNWAFKLFVEFREGKPGEVKMKNSSPSAASGVTTQAVLQPQEQAMRQLSLL